MSKRLKIIYFSLLSLLLVFILLHLNFNSSNSLISKEMSDVIFFEIRLPRLIMAILSGIGLSLSGLLLQTLLLNPLAGPSILGISSGASLFVSLSVLSGISFFTFDIGIISAALMGALLFGLIIILFSLRVKSMVSLLLIGMMLSALTSSIIQMLELISRSSDIKLFTLWGFGSLQHVNVEQLPLISISVLMLVLFSFYLVKPLNIMVLGEEQANLLGVSVKKTRIVLLCSASILTAIITAFCGPISFIGLAIPNIVRILFKTQDHKKIMFGVVLLGSLTMVFCDYLILITEDFVALPLNAITSLFGAPIIIWIILKMKA